MYLNIYRPLLFSRGVCFTPILVRSNHFSCVRLNPRVIFLVFNATSLDYLNF